MKTGKISHPNVGKKERIMGGNEKPHAIPGPNVGAPMPKKPAGTGPMGTHGSWTKGPKPGTKMAK